MINKYKFSIIVALIILYLSFANAHTFDKVPLINIPYADKMVHFLMYFGLAGMMLIERRKYDIKTSLLFLTGLIPFIYGILVEIFQSLLTTTRSGSVFDALADGAGIVAAILLYQWAEPFIKAKIK